MKKRMAFALVLLCVLMFTGCTGQQNEKNGEAVSSSAGADYPAAIMVEDMLYYLEAAMPAEIDESAIVGYTGAYTDGMPQNNGETNFNREIHMPYAKVADGIAVLYENEWWLCKSRE